MAVFIEILSIILQGFRGTLYGIAQGIYELLPAAMQLRKLASYFTPPGIVALYFGVPTVIVTVLFFIARKAMKKAKQSKPLFVLLKSQKNGVMK